MLVLLPPGGDLVGDTSPNVLLKEMKKCAYMQVKLGRLYYHVGIEPVEVGDRTLDLLSAFWRDFEVAQEKTRSVRALIANELDIIWPGWSPSIVGEICIARLDLIDPICPTTDLYLPRYQQAYIS